MNESGTIFSVSLLSNTTALGYIWLVAALVLLLLEVGTPGLFFFLSFAMGATGASIAAFLGMGIKAQCIVALIVALISFAILKMWAKPHEKSKFKTNVDALINQEAVVIETIEPHTGGRIKIKGSEWPALTTNGSILHKGTIVKITGLEGNKLIVK